jgi:hypothetical protein
MKIKCFYRCTINKMSFEPKFGDSTAVNAQMLYSATDNAAGIAKDNAATSNAIAKDNAAIRDVAPKYDNQSHHVERDMIMQPQATNEEHTEEEEQHEHENVENIEGEPLDPVESAFEGVKRKYPDVATYFENDTYTGELASYRSTVSAFIEGIAKSSEISKTHAKELTPLLQESVKALKPYLDERDHYIPAIEGTVAECYDYLTKDPDFELFKKNYEVPTKEAFNEKYKKSYEALVAKVNDDATIEDFVKIKMNEDGEGKFAATVSMMESTFIRRLRETIADKKSSFLGRTELEWKSNFTKLTAAERLKLKERCDRLGRFKETLKRWRLGKCEGVFKKHVDYPSVERLMLIDAINIGTVKSRSLYRLLGVNEATFPEELKIEQHVLDIMKVLRFLAFVLSLEAVDMRYYYSLIMPKNDKEEYVDVGITARSMKDRYTFDNNPVDTETYKKENVMKANTEVSMIVTPSKYISAAELEKDRKEAHESHTDAHTRNWCRHMKRICDLTEEEQEKLGYAGEEILVGGHITHDVLDGATSYQLAKLVYDSIGKSSTPKVRELAEKAARANTKYASENIIDSTMLITLETNGKLNIENEPRQSYEVDFVHHKQTSHLLYKRMRINTESIPLFKELEDHLVNMSTEEKFAELLAFIAFYGNELIVSYQKPTKPVPRRW